MDYCYYLKANILVYPSYQSSFTNLINILICPSTKNSNTKPNIKIPNSSMMDVLLKS